MKNENKRTGSHTFTRDKYVGEIKYGENVFKYGWWYAQFLNSVMFQLI